MNKQSIDITCPCGWSITINDTKFGCTDKTVEHSAKKRAAAHSGSCSYSYNEVEIE